MLIPSKRDCSQKKAGLGASPRREFDPARPRRTGYTPRPVSGGSHARPVTDSAHGGTVVVDRSARVNAATGASLPAHARRRGVVVLVHGRGPGEPWSPGAAVLRGVVSACIDNGIAARWDPLGRAPAVVGPLAQLVAPDADRRTIEVRFGDATCELPRAWIGRHALLVSPMVMPERADDVASGPHVATLGAIAVAARARGGEPVDVGATILAEVFAGFTWLLDGSIAVLRGPRGRATAVACDRVMVHGSTGMSSPRIVAHARRLDAWVGRGIATGARDEAEPDDGGLAITGPLAHAPWPAGARESIGVDGPRWAERPRGRGREARRE
jgi:hypothetical protein